MRLYINKVLGICICSLLFARTYSQNILISGPTSVSPGAIVTYSITYPFPPDGNTNIFWNALNGTITNQGANSLTIQWSTTNGAGSIIGTESDATPSFPGVPNRVYGGSLSVQIGDPNVSVSPWTMVLVYGNPTQPTFTVDVSTIYTVTTLQWQKLIGSVWTNQTTGTSYMPLSDGSYRCVATVNGIPYSSNIVTATYMPLDAGSISLTVQPAYNAVPVVNNTPSQGGQCAPNDRTYSWEQSVNGQPWTTIGTGVSYPSSNVIIGNTYIRRKVTCNGVTKSSNVLYIVPSYTSVDFENINYVRTIDVHIPGISTWQQADQLSMDSKSQGTTYLDGFGRAMQKVAKGASLYNGAWTDLVQPIVYDEAGRITQKYLPYPSTDNPGKFKSANVLTQQASFVTGKFGEPTGAPTYSAIDYDNSPLNRVTKVHAPGQSWSTVSVNSDYDFNNVTENVHIWSLAYTTAAIPVSSPTAVYPTGSLYKSITTDEKGKQVVTYTDLSGNVILKKVQQDDVPVGPHAGWACTYYVYDDFNQLRFTIPAKAVAYLDANSWGLTQQLVDDLCFVYTYDAKGRALSKKQPGVDRIDVVYDQQDRPVFTQDGNGRSNNQWQGVLYDGLGRTTATGVLQQAITTADLQSYVDGHSGAATITTTSTVLGTPVGTADLVVNSRQTDVTEYVANHSITFNPGFTSEAGAQFVARIDAPRTATSNEVVTIGDNSAPAGFITLTQQFYDNYSQIGSSRAYTSTDNSLKDPATSSLAVNLPAQPSPQIRGMATISKVKVITNAADLTQGATWMETDSYYNDQGFVIQVVQDNAMGNTDILSSWLDFTGLSWGSCVKHKDPNQFTIVSRNVYDRQGKLTDVYKNFNNTFSKHLASYSYDEYGKLKNKTLAPGYTGTGKSSMESLDYSYNIQGWLTGINKDYALNAGAGQWDKFFGFYLGYDNADNQFTTAQYNGSITGAIWRSQGDNSMRKYDYTYDNLGRLTSALFHQKKAPADNWSNSAMDLSEYITYEDANGNIHSMKHLGAVPGMAAGTVVDDLTYTYGTSSNRNVNKLSYVHDAATLTGNGQLSDFKDGPNTETTDADYDYDLNGNLKLDLNKGIQAGGITYNYLNKPVKIEISGKKRIEYTYDATGVKLSKKVTDLTGVNPVVNTQYSDEFVYQDGALQYVLHEEGRMKLIVTSSGNSIRNAGSAGANNVFDGKEGVFEYFLKGQLGNTRMVLTEEYQKEIYGATMEISDPNDPEIKTHEEKIFGKVDPSTGEPTADNELALTRVDRSSTPWTDNASDKVVELTAAVSTRKVGPNMILKVSAGDVISAASSYFYFTNDATGPSINTSDVLTPLISALLAGKGSALTKVNGSAIQTNLSVPTGDFASFIGNQVNNGSPTAPKAFLNVLFFDEQFNFIPLDPNTPSIGTNLQRVSQANDQSAEPLLLTQKAPKNGWVYIYLSNESNQSVYFDNLQVSQEHGRIAEENHYYAFGQKIAGICTKAFNKLPPNSFNYQGDYSEEEENTLWNEFDLRMYDPQIGRWTGADPYDQFASPYIGMGDDPVNNVDPDGGGIGYNGINWLGISGEMSVGQIALSRTINSAAGVLVGGIVNSLDKGWNWHNFGDGALWGGLTGLGATYIPWNTIGEFGSNLFNSAFHWTASAVSNMDNVGEVFEELTEITLGSNFQGSTMEDLAKRLISMKTGESMDGKDVEALHPKFKNLPISIPKILDKITRTNDGVQLKFTWLGRSLLSVVPGTPTIKNNAIVKMELVAWPNSNYKVVHLTSQDFQMKYKYSDKPARKGDLNIYLHNNAYTDELGGTKVWKIFKGHWSDTSFDK